MLLAGDDSARYIGMLVEQQSAFQLLRLYQHCVFRVRVFRSENSGMAILLDSPSEIQKLKLKNICKREL